jgi:hypothetical protein
MKGMNMEVEVNGFLSKVKNDFEYKEGQIVYFKEKYYKLVREFVSGGFGEWGVLPLGETDINKADFLHPLQTWMLIEETQDPELLRLGIKRLSYDEGCLL